MARIAQISIRFEHLAISEARFRELGPEIDQVAAEVARRIYGDGVTLDVYVEAGSLFTRLTIIGGLLLGTYHSVAEYKDFKAGLVELTEDAAKFGEQVHKEISKLTGGAKADSVKNRKVTPSKILKVIEELDTYEKESVRYTEPAAHIRLRKIVRDIQAIERDLTPEELKRFSDRVEEYGLRPIAELPKRRRERRKGEEPVAERERAGKSLADGSQERKRRTVLRYHNRFPLGKRP
jgi:hypothetical protein